MRIWSRVKRLMTKDPRYVLGRVYQELCDFGRYFTVKQRLKQFEEHALLRETQQESIGALWSVLEKKPAMCAVDAKEMHAIVEKNAARYAAIQHNAQEACAHRVQLLGYPVFQLPEKIDWSKDYKSGVVFQKQYYKKVRYLDFTTGQDVKIPWELARFQWLIPVALRYLQEGNEADPLFVRETLHEWIVQNPFEYGIHWACTMEVAMRLIVVIGLFHFFSRSTAWQDSSWQLLLVQFFYQHAVFIEQHLEKSDVNGNHYTADAAGLVFAGVFLEGERATRWKALGLQILEEELPKQVSTDGVDFEGSLPYHRLVTELFFWPALYVKRSGESVSNQYLEKLRKMAYFIADYSYKDGTTPLWGDNDMARVLPLGVQAVSDHRAACGLVGSLLEDEALIQHCQGPAALEVALVFGVSKSVALSRSIPSAFRLCEYSQGGYYILKENNAQVFIDVADVGLAGRGGHGHNDFLAFELCLGGQKIFVDTGCGAYTGDPHVRNRGRSVLVHNTPQWDGLEQFPFVRWDALWELQKRVYPVHLQEEERGLTATVQHSFFQQKRAFHLKGECFFSVQDTFILEEKRPKPLKLRIPFVLCPEIEILSVEGDRFFGKTPKGVLLVAFKANMPIRCVLEPLQIYPEYGLHVETQAIVLYLAFDTGTFTMSTEVSFR